MDAVTYPDPDLQAAIAEHFVPLRLVSGEHPELARRCLVRWLPAVVVMSADGRVHHVSVGWLPAELLDLELRFGRALAAMASRGYDEAKALFEGIIADRPDHERAPEAAYWRAVGELRRSKDYALATPLFLEVAQRWPDSLWATKVGWMGELLADASG